MHIYNDGSIHLNHGGTEMGQGLNTKVSQVVADVFQVDLDRVKITATTTAKVPNTSATAASSGSDLNGMAAQNAAEQIKERLIDFAVEAHSVEREQVVFEPNVVRIGNRRVAFDELIREAYLGRVHMSAAGFYKTPEIHWDRAAGKGRPFYYFAYGASVSEVSVDTLTGEYHVDRTDILHDVGPLAEPGGGPGAGRRRLHPGDGVADHRGALVGRQGAAADACALDLQDPAGERPAGDLQRQARRLVGEPGADDPAVEGGRRAAADAGGLGARGAVDGGGERGGLPGMPAARYTGDPGAAADGGDPAERSGAVTVRPEAVDRFRGDQGVAALARVELARGSTPRESGAWMVVGPHSTLGTVGGGQLEYMVIDAARAMLARGQDAQTLDIPLGPEIGQCCGGRTVLALTQLGPEGWAALRATAEAERRALPEVHVFGAGHVGRALAAALALLPVRPVLVDQRTEELRLAPVGIDAVLTPLPEEVVRLAAPGGAFVVLTHDHALDFLIVREALARGDAAYVGHDRLADQAGVVPELAATQRGPGRSGGAGLPDRRGRAAGQAAGGDRRLRGGGDHAAAACRGAAGRPEKP